MSATKPHSLRISIHQMLSTTYPQHGDSHHGLLCTTHMDKDIREPSLASIPARSAGDVAPTYLAATTRKPGVRPLHLSWNQMPGGGRHNTVTMSYHVPAAHLDLPLPHSRFVCCVPSKPIKQRLPKVSRPPELLPWLNRGSSNYSTLRFPLCFRECTRFQQKSVNA